MLLIDYWEYWEFLSFCYIYVDFQVLERIKCFVEESIKGDVFIRYGKCFVSYYGKCVVFVV